MEYLFTYGLFRDSGRIVLGKDATYCGKASIEGKLYKVNEFYPGYVPGKGKVWGDVYLFNPENLPAMDEYEGDEYVRKQVITSTDVKCWVYEYKYDVSEFEQIKCGDWMLR
jgi:gamma-glutamylcyclotransferase (GGCT)/AIG2-like uncharacterized protein YtfP